MDFIVMRSTQFEKLVQFKDSQVFEGTGLLRFPL